MSNKQTKNKTSRQSLISTIIVCALLIVFGMTAIFLSGFDWHSGISLGGLSQVGHSAQIGGAIAETDKAEDWDYFDDAVMVGDSITYGMASYGYLSFNHVFAKIGLHQGTALTSKCVYTSKTQGYSISDALKMAKPGKIYVTLGINAIYNYKADSFYDNYRALLMKIKKASPDSVIVIQSIFPVTENWAINNGKPNCNQYIAYANQKLSELANEEGCYFLHTYEKLTDENGFLQREFSGDGIHLSRKGYEAVFNYILTHPIKSSGEFTKIGAITPPAPQVSTTSKVTMPNLGDISSSASTSSSEDTQNTLTSSEQSSSEAATETSSESSSQESSDAASVPTITEPQNPSQPQTETESNITDISTSSQQQAPPLPLPDDVTSPTPSDEMQDIT